MRNSSTRWKIERAGSKGKGKGLWIVFSSSLHGRENPKSGGEIWKQTPGKNEIFE